MDAKEIIMATKTPKSTAEKPQSVREQKGHSIILHICLIFVGVGIFTIPYISLSKGHYWHL